MRNGIPTMGYFGDIGGDELLRNSLYGCQLNFQNIFQFFLKFIRFIFKFYGCEKLSKTKNGIQNQSRPAIC